MKPLGTAVAFALAGVAASCGVAWWAARQWSTFSDTWLFSACILPIFGALGGAWWGTEKGKWPPGMIGGLPLAVISGAFAGVGSYLAFALVALTWHGGLPGAGDLVSKLLDPSSIPEIATTRRGYTLSTGVVAHAAICAGVGTILPLWWLRKPKH